MTTTRMLLLASMLAGACKSDGASEASSADERAARSEPPAVFAELKLRQQQYYVENGAYLSTGGEQDLFPSIAGERVSSKRMPESWKTLRVRLDSEQLRCGYVAVAGVPGGAGNVGAIAESFGFAPPSASWFYLLARCPSIDALFFTSSNSDQIETRPL